VEKLSSYCYQILYVMYSYFIFLMQNKIQNKSEMDRIDRCARETLPRLTVEASNE